jgi:hypothetical protein
MVITTAVGIIHSTGMPRMAILRTSGLHYIIPWVSMKWLIFDTTEPSSNPYCVARILLSN